ncbi:hypothetical protein Hanom_Chr08g00713371 [Helianthus anomalus]
MYLQFQFLTTSSIHSDSQVNTDVSQPSNDTQPRAIEAYQVSHLLLCFTIHPCNFWV